MHRSVICFHTSSNVHNNQALKYDERWFMLEIFSGPSFLNKYKVENYNIIIERKACEDTNGVTGNNEQTMTYKSLHRNQKIERHEPQKIKYCWNRVLRKGKQLLLHLLAIVVEIYECHML